jgi:hypothetical protein
VNQWHSYRIGRRIGTSIYRPYLASLHRAKETLAQLGIEVPLPKAKSGFKVRYDRFWKVLKHIEGWARI